MNLSRKNHYVPEWYQKRFLNFQNSYYYLNIKPREKILANGKKIQLNTIWKRGPKKCFKLEDLYSITIFGIVFDDIERFLFGNIDTKGSIAIDFLVKNKLSGLPEIYENLFIYMNIQKIRTIKGLDWIKSKYYNLNQTELMQQLNELSTMYCTMWIEGVLEIVSAKNSTTKFIVSDHPITVYNKALPPSSEICQYPDDPPISMIGSQTIFPLDLNNCLIMTNLDYAKQPNRNDLTDNRINTRYNAQTLTRTNNIIRKRELNESEVIQINYIIKRRANKFIAGLRKEWLYPEKFLKNTDWSKLSKILRPPEKELFHFGGEIYASGKDGKLIWYQDQYGRRFKEYKDNKINNASIKDRNLWMYKAIFDIFGINKGKDWYHIRKSINETKVKHFYEVLHTLWHPNTEILNLIPKPDNKLTGLFLGICDHRLIDSNIISYLLYTDKVIMISPLPNPWFMKDDYNPIKHPEQYIDKTIYDLNLLLKIFPLVAQEVIELIPNPCDFIPELRFPSIEMAEKRLKKYPPGKEELEYLGPLRSHDRLSLLVRLPKKMLRLYVENNFKDLDCNDKKKLVHYIINKRKIDPYVNVSKFNKNKNDNQMLHMQLGGNLEIGFLIAQLTGSYILTDMPFKNKEFLSAVIEPIWDNSVLEMMKPLSNFDFPFFRVIDASFLLYIRNKGRFSAFRGFINRLGDEIVKQKNQKTKIEKIKIILSKLDDVTSACAIDIANIQNDLKEFNRINDLNTTLDSFKGKIELNIPDKGFGFKNSYQLLAKYCSSQPYIKNIPFSVFLNLGQERYDHLK